MTRRTDVTTNVLVEFTCANQVSSSKFVGQGRALCDKSLTKARALSLTELPCLGTREVVVLIRNINSCYDNNTHTKRVSPVLQEAPTYYGACKMDMVHLNVFYEMMEER